MAQIVLTAAANSAASRFGLSQFSKLALQTGARILGRTIDNSLVSSRQNRRLSSYRLDELNVQTSTYGKMIPIIYGTSRIAGNIIWSQPIKENVNVESSGGKGGVSGSSETETYSYTVTIAIAICEGEINDIIRVWADTKVIDPNLGEYRLYKGTESQNPDPFIEAIEGIGKTPAYRGLAYIVIEDFPLADYGNRIPNFSFEVKKKTKSSSVIPVEEKIKSMVMIPGSGEFVYDTETQQKQQGELVGDNWLQQGESTYINQNNRHNKADALVSLDQLENTCPNIDWISVVVGWFADNLDIANTDIKPGVEFNNINTIPDQWKVSSFNRSNAYQITKDSNGNPVYGGTISDDSLIRYIDELRSRGFKIMLYPLFFMDTQNKPWRGRLTGSSSDVNNFFNKTNGYNDFYNSLC